MRTAHWLPISRPVLIAHVLHGKQNCVRHRVCAHCVCLFAVCYFVCSNFLSAIHYYLADCLLHEQIQIDIARTCFTGNGFSTIVGEWQIRMERHMNMGYWSKSLKKLQDMFMLFNVCWQYLLFPFTIDYTKVLRIAVNYCCCRLQLLLNRSIGRFLSCAFLMEDAFIMRSIPPLHLIPAWIIHSALIIHADPVKINPHFDRKYRANHHKCS